MEEDGALAEKAEADCLVGLNMDDVVVCTAPSNPHGSLMLLSISSFFIVSGQTFYPSKKIYLCEYRLTIRDCSAEWREVSEDQKLWTSVR